MTNNNIMGVGKVIAYPDVSIAIIVCRGFLVRSSADIFCYILILILTVSVLFTCIPKPNIVIKALFSVMLQKRTLVQSFVQVFYECQSL